MADKRITDLAVLDSAELDATIDVLAVADVSASETKKVTASALISKALGQVPEDTINGDLIIDGSISGDKLSENSVTARELAPNSVNTVHVVDAAITNDKLAGDITNDKLAAGIDGSKLQDASVSSDKLIGGITNDQLVGGITGDKINDGQIGSNHLQADAVDGQTHVQDRSIPAIKLQQNTLTADEIAPNAIGASELASGSVDTDALQNDACSTPKYQDASVTDAKLANGIDGAKLQDGSVTNAKLAGGIDGDNLNDVPLSKLPKAPHNTVLAGPQVSGTESPSYRPLVPADLPAATAATAGAVSVPADGGLSVALDGAVRIANSAIAGTSSVVTYDEHGLIKSGRNLEASDLPPAAPGQIGGVKPGDGISISGDGTISQSVTGVVAGEYTKITVDERGSVTQGKQLEASDIPNLEYSQINGTLDLATLNGQVRSDQIQDDAILKQHLADYSITYIQEGTPSTTSSDNFVGCMWFQESTASLNMWNGNSWMSIGQGRLSAENLRYCGLVDASTGLITAVTQFGVSEGLSVGDAIPVASDERTGAYFVIETAGDQILQTPGESYNPGDWCLCSGAAAGWSRINTLNGGGGGGGATRLNDLIDVNVGSAVTGALLQLQSDSTWQEATLIDCGSF